MNDIQKIKLVQDLEKLQADLDDLHIRRSQLLRDLADFDLVISDKQATIDRLLLHAAIG